MAHMLCVSQIEMKDEIEDEEITLEEFIDKKMLDWDMESVERMYSVASQCLNERKNRRPLMKEVRVALKKTQEAVNLIGVTV